GAKAVPDSPWVLAVGGGGIPGGNSQADPVARAGDNRARGIAKIGALSGRRTALMMEKHMSHLPPFLGKNGGVNSGFMIAQVTAPALARENKALSHPHSVHRLPTSLNQDNHARMGPAAGRRLWGKPAKSRG
ncbi:aromatic amino acid lyase, partial [Salmonella enterica]|uniref:aromatic amino acid lyase n=1 Tax=Salmonella enterica TaxID=28901 RepID=UPI00398C6682